MTRILEIYRGVSGSQVVYYTNEETAPSGLSNVSLVLRKEIDPRIGAGSNISISPIEAWTFDGDSGLTGSVSGTLLTLAAGTKTFSAGPQDGTKALYFDAATYYQADILSFLHLKFEATITAVIKPVTIEAVEKIFVCCGGTSSAPDNNILYRLNFYTDDNALVAFHKYGAGGGGSAFINPDPVYSVPPGDWAHCALSRDASGNNYLYLNGIQIHSGSYTLPDYGDQTFITIGASQTGGDKFNGYISEVKIFSGSLSADEIRKEYLAVLGDNIY